MPDNRNLLIAIVLSVVVLVGWQYFIAAPQLAKQQQQQQLQQQQKAAETPAAAGTAATAPAAGGAVPPAGDAAGADALLTREAALALTPRVPIATERVSGSIDLRGARLDDLRLTEFRETVDPTSPTIILLSPSRSSTAAGPNGYFAEFGWIGDAALKPPVRTRCGRPRATPG